MLRLARRLAEGKVASCLPPPALASLLGAASPAAPGPTQARRLHARLPAERRAVAAPLSVRLTHQLSITGGRKALPRARHPWLTAVHSAPPPALPPEAAGHTRRQAAAARHARQSLRAGPRPQPRSGRSRTTRSASRPGRGTGPRSACRLTGRSTERACPPGLPLPARCSAAMARAWPQPSSSGARGRPARAHQQDKHAVAGEAAQAKRARDAHVHVEDQREAVQRDHGAAGPVQAALALVEAEARVAARHGARQHRRGGLRALARRRLHVAVREEGRRAPLLRAPGAVMRRPTCAARGASAPARERSPA
jgi:hypothetical protein